MYDDPRIESKKNYAVKNNHKDLNSELALTNRVSSPTLNNMNYEREINLNNDKSNSKRFNRQNPKSDQIGNNKNVHSNLNENLNMISERYGLDNDNNKIKNVIFENKENDNMKNKLEPKNSNFSQNNGTYNNNAQIINKADTSNRNYERKI